MARVDAWLDEFLKGLRRTADETVKQVSRAAHETATGVKKAADETSQRVDGVLHYTELLEANQVAIEAAVKERGGNQIKFYYEKATAAHKAQNPGVAIKNLKEAIRLVGVANARNPYIAAFDKAKKVVEPMLGVRIKEEDENAEAVKEKLTQLKKEWDEQDGHAKKAEYKPAEEKAKAAEATAGELKGLIAGKSGAATEKLQKAEQEVADKTGDLLKGIANQETRKESLAEARKLVKDLFDSTNEAKDVGVLDSGLPPKGGGVPDRVFGDGGCEAIYKKYDWFELKRRLNLPELGVEQEKRENFTPGEMRQLWNWRSKEVNKLIDDLRSEFPTLIAKACGSNDLESDIDITFATPGGDHYGDDIKAAKKFNERVIARFGKPAGRTFDVNIYSRDYRAIKESRNQEYNAEPIKDVDVDQPGEPKDTGGMDFRSASAEDQDVAALMKQRRFMSGKQWETHRKGVLDDVAEQLRAKNPQVDLEKDPTYNQIAKQLDEAEDVFLLSLRKMLVGIQKSVAKLHPETLKTEKFRELEALLRDPNAVDVAERMQKLHRELTSGEHAAVVMEATDEMYLDQMAEVRENQKKIEEMPEGPEKESLKLQVKKEIFTNIFFANEAYTSEGAISHVVAGAQAGLSTEELAKKLKPTETVQSANEQLADLLKDMEHYEEEEHDAREDEKAMVAGQAFVHASKYLERLLDATAILAAQFAKTKDSDPEPPDLTWFATHVQDGEVTSKGTLKEKSEALQKRVKGLLLSLRKTSKVPGDLKKALAVDEIQQLFGVSTIQAFTGVMMELGRELNSVVRMRGEFQTAVKVDKEVNTTRMENVDLGKREGALNDIRKLVNKPLTPPAAGALAGPFSNLDLGESANVGPMAARIASAWKEAADAYAEEEAGVLKAAVGRLTEAVKAVPDIEVNNELQGVVRWYDQAWAMLKVSGGDNVEAKAAVGRIGTATRLAEGLALELTHGDRWEQAKFFPGANARNYKRDANLELLKINEVVSDMEVDLINDALPPEVKQRIEDTARTLLLRRGDLERRLVELEKYIAEAK